MSKDSVLIIGGGLLQVPAVEAAHSLGLRAIVTDRDPDAPAMKLADEAHAIDIYDVSQHVALGMGLKDRLRGVFTEGADVEVTVASVAAALGLPGISVEAARNCKDKIRMRQLLGEAGIGKLWWMRDAVLTDLLPVVIKPSDNCASRGINVVREEGELDRAIQEAVANSSDGHWLSEEYLIGPQQSVEILFDARGQCFPLNIVDRIFEGIMELGHVNPSNLPDGQKAELFNLTQQAAQAVGVHFGAFKCDTIWTKDGPRILECTARLSGGFDCQYTTPLSSGRNFIRAAMRLACGMDLDHDADLRPTLNRYAAAWAAFPKPGRVRNIIQGGGLLTPTEQYCFLRVKPGDIIEPYENCAGRPGFVIVVGDAYGEAVEYAKLGAAAMAERIITE